MQKVVINNRYGGFCLSDAAREYMQWDFKKDGYDFDMERDNPKLVACVETLGDKANGEYAALKVVEVPFGVKWKVEQYEGNEWVAEVHRTWG